MTDPTSNYRFILDDKGRPVPEPDLIKWAEWFEKAGGTRIVKKDKVGNYLVSTVFLALDYGWDPTDILYKPLLFETMIFDESKEGGNDIYQERCTTKTQALKQHDKAITWLKKKKLV